MTTKMETIFYRGVVAFAEDDLTVLYFAPDTYTTQIPDLTVDIRNTVMWSDYPKDMKLANCFEYYIKESSILKKTNYVPRPEYALWQAQIIYTMRVAGFINWFRRKGHKNNIAQQEIYAMKVAEAERILGGSGITAEDVPMVANYAKNNGIDLVTAAKVVTLAAEEQKQRLIKSELMREDFNTKVKLCKTPEEVKALFEQFRTSYFVPFKLGGK
jgi:hypothetical protein